MTCILLTGCLSFNFYGNFRDSIQLEGLKYTGGDQKASYTVGQAVDGDPIWAFTQGTATYDLDFHIGINLSGSDNSSKGVAHCTGSYVYEVTGGVYKDLDLVFPPSSGNN